ncbi:MAG: CRTAC1 family protein [Acidobacteria bacterium]|nr:CRTAC1 family protein [Acidobacteriota bacterium]
MTPLAAEEGSPVFVDRAAELGVDFTHDNGMTGELYFAENMGGGAALFDADGDGDLDLYLGQGHRLAPRNDAAASSVSGTAGPRDRLFRNNLEKGALRFTDITEESGLDARGYGMGVAVGDIDNDGDSDLYILNLGPNELWRNDSEPGAIRFTNITAGSNTADPRWSAGASFFDLDGDGLLDLFVGNYVEFRVAIHKTCSSPQGLLDYCGPKAYRDEPNRVLRNRGNGVFEDWTFRLGVGDLRRPTLGMVATDLNGDGTIDIYVANDQSPNTLLLNQGGTALVDEAVLAGAAVDAEGQPEASMGVLAEDFNGDGLVDLFMTHLQHQTNTLYVNEGDGFWEDRTRRSGLGQPSFVYTGFGTAAMDYDLDGELDIYVANGAVKRIEEQVRTGDPHPLREPNQLFRGLGGGRFEEVPDFERPAVTEVGRGVARGDLDNDGDPDLVVVNNGGPVQVLINERAPDDRDWLGVDLRLAPAGEARLGRRALGAWLGTVEADEARSWRRFHTDGSYASANDPRVIVVFPTGPPTTLVARWPDGATETFPVEVAREYVTLVRGEGSTETRKRTP